MQPETSAQYQHRFSQAIRGGEAADGLPQDRLNVYIRLIRNNIHSFIDRCYTETRQYFDSKEWSRLKEGFVRDARAQTPYFQEIPGEFLQYCQSPPLSDGILALMDFEYTQLLAEVAQIPDIPDIHYSNDSKYTPSPAAFIRQYRYDVTHDLQEAETALLIWRNAEDDVMYQTLDGFDMMLLEIMVSPRFRLTPSPKPLSNLCLKPIIGKIFCLGNGQAGLNKGLSSPPCPPYPKIWKAIPRAKTIYPHKITLFPILCRYPT